jgi:hypothetical protein
MILRHAARTRRGRHPPLTEDNRRKNISVEAKRGDDSLESAHILLAAAMHADGLARGIGWLPARAAHSA